MYASNTRRGHGDDARRDPGERSFTIAGDPLGSLKTRKGYLRQWLIAIGPLDGQNKLTILHKLE
jgi:hypothetical protein